MSMRDATPHRNAAVNTVLGPIPASELGVVAIHESLISVVPGAQYAYDITLDQAEIFETVAAKLRRFKAAGGGTVVDSTGMFHGRDLPQLETLARATGVHIVASTGMGPEENLGGYFLTPQTNPPTPWPAEKFAELLTQEVREGMVVPRLERRAPAGLVVAEADRSGITPTEISLFQGSARAAIATGAALSIRWGKDALTELETVFGEGIEPNRIIVAGLDRKDAGDVALTLASRGVYVAIDHIGNSRPDFIDDNARIALVVALVEQDFANRILLSTGSIAYAAGLAPVETPFEYLLTDFAPGLERAGIAADVVRSILVNNPREVLTVHAGKGA